jgi:hypothetical protein
MTIDITGTDSTNVLPEGEYQVDIIESGIMTSRNNTKYLAVTYQVAGGKHIDQKLIDRFFIFGPSESKWPKQRLANLLDVVDLPKRFEEKDLIGRKLRIKVIVKNSADFGDQNEVKAYMSINSYPAGQKAQNALNTRPEVEETEVPEPALATDKELPF